MSYWPDRKLLVITLYTLLAGAAGAGLAYWLSLPLYILTGPAILVSTISLTGIRFEIADPVRDVALLLIGIVIGSGVNGETTAAILRWPLAFLALLVMLVMSLMICRFLLTRFFGFDPRSAILASTPGHLSFVLTTSAELNLNVANIATVQSVRLLALTLVVPFMATAFGVKVDGDFLPVGQTMQTAGVIIMFAVSLGLGLVLKRARIPAPLLMGGLMVSSSAHIVDLTPGVPAPEMVLGCFMVLGTMIGSRFSGITLVQLRRGLVAGLLITIVAVVLAAIAALSISAFLAMPPVHVIVAFAPGGLETMVSMGILLGANPGFIAACHIGRLLLLSAMIPFFLGRNKISHRP